MKFNLKHLIVPHFWKKFVIMVVGIFLMGFFLSFLIDVSWGTDPCTFQNKIISDRLSENVSSFFTFGNWNLLLNTVLFIIVLIFDWHLIGLGTIFNMVLIGYTADFFRWVWSQCFPMFIYTDPAFLWAKILVFVISIFMFVVSAAFYMNADMGLSPYDAIPKIISDRCPKVSYTVIRIIYDSTPIVIGLIASIGVTKKYIGSMLGSIIMAFTLGPVITFIGKNIKRWFFREDLEDEAATETVQVQE